MGKIKVAQTIKEFLVEVHWQLRSSAVISDINWLQH